MAHHSASFSVTLRVRIEDAVDGFANLASAVAKADGRIDAIDLVRIGPGYKVRDISVLSIGDEHAQAIIEACQNVEGASVERVSDPTLLMHLGGKIAMQSKIPVKTRNDLSMAYTPGVARVCNVIAADPESAWSLTIKRNSVAVVTDGTAVLGLGNIGPKAAMPVMEGKALLFKEFGGVDAWPICLDSTDTDRIVEAVQLIAPGFGGINLEDISSPRCFEIEDRLRESLDIPVFHDDQHGTAVVTLAAFLNALQLVDKAVNAVKVVVTGIGAAGVAVTKTLQAAGVQNVVGVDSRGAVHRGRSDLTDIKRRYAETTNPENLTGTADEALRGADVFIGLSQPGAVTIEGVRGMAAEPIIFAMANPTPEIAPEEVEHLAAIVATGRSDYPNQINNVLAFPGIFRGALDVRASDITDRMKVEAGYAIARAVAPDELAPDYIVPSVFNRDVAVQVAAAVAAAAEVDGIARRARDAAGITQDA